MWGLRLQYSITTLNFFLVLINFSIFWLHVLSLYSHLERLQKVKGCYSSTVASQIDLQKKNLCAKRWIVYDLQMPNNFQCYFRLFHVQFFAWYIVNYKTAVKFNRLKTLHETKWTCNHIRRTVLCTTTAAVAVPSDCEISKSSCPSLSIAGHLF